MSCVKYALLNDGRKFPLIGLGTFRIRGRDTIFQVIDTGLKTGYNSFDTAAVYQNEHDIGNALNQLLSKYNLKRENIFITTKLSPSDQGAGKVEAAVFRSLQQLQTSYIDLYLIHWPGAGGVTVDSKSNAALRSETWQQLVKLHHKGVLKSIGVSNYTVRHLQELLSNCYGVKPAVNQVELHPRYKQTELLKYCKQENILVQAYCSLGGTSNTNLVLDPIVRAVATEVGKSPAQVLLKWALQQDVAIIPKSVTPTRIQENIELDFILSDTQMTQLNSISTTEKYAWNPDTVL